MQVEVTGAAAMPLLNLQGKEPLKVSFRAIPSPSHVVAWKSFRIQIDRATTVRRDAACCAMPDGVALITAVPCAAVDTRPRRYPGEASLIR